MNDLNPFAHRRAKRPPEPAVPGSPETLERHLAPPFRSDWNRLMEAARRCDHLTLRSVGAFRACDGVFEVPRALFTGPKSGGDPIRLALFAGLGGDDRLAREAAVSTLLSLCRHPSQATGVELYTYPVPDPASLRGVPDPGIAARNLASDFWCGSDDPAVYFLERELGVFRFHGVIVLGSVPRSGGLGLHLDSLVLRSLLQGPLERSAARFLSPGDLPDPGAAVCVGDSAARLVDSPELPTRAFGMTLCLPAAAGADSVCQAVAAVLQTLIEHYGAILPLGRDI